MPMAIAVDKGMILNIRELFCERKGDTNSAIKYIKKMHKFLNLQISLLQKWVSLPMTTWVPPK